MLRLEQRGFVLAVIGVLCGACGSDGSDQSDSTPSSTGGSAADGGRTFESSETTQERGGSSAFVAGTSTVVSASGGSTVRSSLGGRDSGSSVVGGASTSVTTGGLGGSGARTSAGASSTSLGGATFGVSGSSFGGVGKGGSSASTATCPERGNVTYTLAKAATPTAQEQAAYDKITSAMDEAVRYYDCYTNITKALKVSYVPSVQTADGNINGSIRFGSTASMNRVTAMHEIAHTVGIGTAANWSTFIVDSHFTGANALAELKAIPTHTTEVIGADKSHFWPYGLNYESEGKTLADLVAHCRMVMAIRRDLGLE
ncbi:MAG: hypothetical protein QM784_31575 [Polyangiaceae bacterium]